MPLGELRRDGAVFHPLAVARNLSLTLGCALVDLVESPWLRDVQTELHPLLDAALRPPLAPLLLGGLRLVLPPGERTLCVAEVLVRFHSILSRVALLLPGGRDRVGPRSPGRSVHHLHPGRGVGASLGSRAPVSPARKVSAALEMLALNRLDLEVDDVVRRGPRPARRGVWRLM